MNETKKRLIPSDLGKAHEIIETKVVCPNCNKEAMYTETTYNVENFGPTLFNTFSCEHCNLKVRDVQSLARDQQPTKYTVHVNTIQDLETKIIRAHTASLKIPEFGIEVTPTHNTEGYYNNIEGFLDLCEQAARTGTGKKAREQLEKIQKAKNAEVKFTVILEDPAGRSTLVGKNVKKETIKKEILKK